MGRAVVRQAVQSALQAAVLSGAIPLVGSVFPARAYTTEYDYERNAAGYYVQSVNGSGCVLVVNLPGPEKRMLRALVGRGAVNDTYVHPVVLELFFASRGGGSAQGDQLIAAQTDYDSVTDAITVFIRNNPILADPAQVWSAGEYAAGVVHQQSAPYTDAEGTTTFINGTIRFDAWEWISGTGV